MTAEHHHIGLGARATGAACAILLATGSMASAGVLIDFDVQEEYTSNFTELRFGSQTDWVPISSESPAVNAAFGAYLWTRTSVTTTATLYNGAVGLTDSIELDYWTNSLRSADPAHFGIITRRREDTGRGVLALATFTGTTSLRLTLYYDSQFTTTNNTANTAFWDATFDLSNGTITHTLGTGGTGSTNSLTASGNAGGTSNWNSIVPYHLKLDQTAGDDPMFRFTISDAQGLVASTGFVALTATDAYNAAGAAGFRIGNNGGTIHTGVDNWAITPTPEPTTLAFLGVAGLALLRRRRAM